MEKLGKIINELKKLEKIYCKQKNIIMKNLLKNYTLVAVRKGSQRVKNKNIRKFVKQSLEIKLRQIRRISSAKFY